MNHTINFNTYCGCKDKFFPNYSLVHYLRYLVPFLRFEYFPAKNLSISTRFVNRSRNFRRIYRIFVPYFTGYQPICNGTKGNESGDNGSCTNTKSEESLLPASLQKQRRPLSSPQSCPPDRSCTLSHTTRSQEERTWKKRTAARQKSEVSP